MVAKYSSAMEITEQEFSKVIKINSLVVADFFSERNMSCLMLTPILEELAESIKKIKFVKINIDESRRLFQNYKVFHFPCWIIFKNGKEIERMTGARVEEAEEIIQNHLNSE